MTNNEIIAASVLETVGTEAVSALAATIYTPPQLAAPQRIPATFPKTEVDGVTQYALF